MSDAFFIPTGESRFQPTDWCRGPWTPEAMHGSPPAALLGRALEGVRPRDDALFVRASFELLGPVPLEPLLIEAEVVRPGRSVEMIDASLRTSEREVMRARAWRIRVETLDVRGPERLPFPTGPADSPELPPQVAWEGRNYISAMEWRFASGSFERRGPASCWFRMRVALVQGEQPSPFQRVLCAADSASGISNELDFRSWIYVNPDLTVLLHRYPLGEWICLDAATVVEPHGTGLCTSQLYDETGLTGTQRPDAVRSAPLARALGTEDAVSSRSDGPERACFARHARTRSICLGRRARSEPAWDRPRTHGPEIAQRAPDEVGEGGARAHADHLRPCAPPSAARTPE